ncbi:MAG: hypothetical protein JST82_12625 [Bacteroidetes bacterium]|nr:hypothetical protein [Bacteroidota bacterium]
MKLITTLAISSLVIFASCKKDYKCTCTTTYAGTSTTTVYEHEMRNRTHLNAQEVCDAYAAQENQKGISNTKCTF